MATRAVVGPAAAAVLIQAGSIVLCAILLAVGLLTDLLDGVLARRFSVSTAKLRGVDSWVDTWFYLWIIAAVFATHIGQVLALRVPLIAVVVTQVISWTVDWAKFGRLSTYHALMAKIWGPLIAVALMALVVFDYSGIILIAIAWGVLSHTETTAITLALPAYQDDVLTIPRAWRIRRRWLDTGVERRRPSILDRVLRLDSARSPNHVGAVLILDSNGDGLRTIENRLRARAAADDGSPDLQVKRRRLQSPGSRSQLFRLVESLHVGPLRRELPPWEAYVIEGLTPPLSAIYVKAHHSTTDGLGGLHELFEVLGLQFRSTPTVSPVAGRKSPVAWWALLTATCIRPLVRPAPRLPFNRPVGPARRIIGLRFPVDAVQGVARSSRASVNDVMLAAVAEGLHRDLVSCGRTNRRQSARIFVPVSVRRPTDPPMGNLVAAVAVELPLESSSLRDRIEQTRTRTNWARSQVGKAGVNAAICATTLPLALLGGVASRIGVERQWMYNLTVSNLGSTGTHDARGALRLVEFYPLTSLALDLAISVCVITHSDTLYVSLVGDARVANDLEVIATGIRDCLCDSRASGGMSHPI